MRDADGLRLRLRQRRDAAPPAITPLRQVQAAAAADTPPLFTARYCCRRCAVQCCRRCIAAGVARLSARPPKIAAAAS